MPDLPRPDVKAEVLVGDTDFGSVHKADVTISRGGTSRSYSSTATSGSEAVKGVVEQIIADPFTAEWIPAPRKPD